MHFLHLNFFVKTCSQGQIQDFPWGAKPKGDHQLIIWPKFHQNFMKINKIWPIGEARIHKLLCRSATAWAIDCSARLTVKISPESKTSKFHSSTVTDSGFPRDVGANSKAGCEKLLLSDFFPRNCMKFKEYSKHLDPEEGRPWRPLRSANAQWNTPFQAVNLLLNIRSKWTDFYCHT